MSADVQLAARPHGFTAMQYAICLKGIVWREALRFLHQRERFVAALVRPLVWLFIFAAGFRQVLGLSIIPPYETYILYEVYITPGLMVMIQLFSGMYLLAMTCVSGVRASNLSFDGRAQTGGLIR